MEITETEKNHVNRVCSLKLNKQNVKMLILGRIKIYYYIFSAQQWNIESMLIFTIYTIPFGCNNSNIFFIHLFNF